MTPTYNQNRYKTCARKNATPAMEISDEEESDCEIFVSDEARRRFTDNISSRSVFSERGFIMDFDHETLSLPSSIGSLIKEKKWGKFCQHPQAYNTQLVKEFYSNIRPSNKTAEVMVRGVCVSYSEGTINMMHGLKKGDDAYEEILKRAGEEEYEVYMQSLCQPGAKWVEAAEEKSVRRMDLLPETKAWYQFIKHSVKPTTHNETVNKQRLALLHCIIAGYSINVGRIIMQEIQACGRKKEGMLYFPCLITALCMKQGVKGKDTDEISNPKAGFDWNALQVLMKQRTAQKGEKGQRSTAEDVNNENGSGMWKLLKKMQKDQKDFFEFQKKKHEWEARVFMKLESSEVPPLFPNHILEDDDEEAEKESEKTPAEKKKGKEPMKEERTQSKLKKTISDPSASTAGTARRGPKMRFPIKTVEAIPSEPAKKKDAVIQKKDQKERVEIVLDESSDEEPQGSVKYYSTAEEDQSGSEDEEGCQKDDGKISTGVPSKGKAQTPVKESKKKRRFDGPRKSPRKSNRLRA